MSVNQLLLDIKRTQIEMMDARGYQINDDEKEILREDYTLLDFANYLKRLKENNPQIKNLRELLSEDYFKYVVVDGEDVLVRSYVHYISKIPNNTTISKQQIESIKAKLKSFIYDGREYPRVSEYILIINANISPQAMEVLPTLSGDFNDQERFVYQIFKDEELYFNPNKHVDSAIHELIPRNEMKAKLAELKVKESQLPLISINDPIIKFYGYEIGDLIRVHRDDSFIGVLSNKSVNYRIVAL